MLSVYRLDTSKKELMETVVCIFDELITFEKDDALCKALSKIGLSKDFAKLAVRIYKSYNTFLKHYLPEHEQFHGLRDFYGMSKLFCYKYLTYIIAAIQENIGTLNSDHIDTILLTINDRIKIDEATVKEFLMQAYLRHFSGMPDALKYLLLSLN
jgi:E3 ubiquitin-protein ligase RNF213